MINQREETGKVQGIADVETREKRRGRGIYLHGHRIFSVTGLRSLGINDFSRVAINMGKEGKTGKYNLQRWGVMARDRGGRRERRVKSDRGFIPP